MRISEIGLASGCVGPTRTVTPSLALLLLRRAAKRREVAGAVSGNGSAYGDRHMALERLIDKGGSDQPTQQGGGYRSRS
jgi:hypothetical protein